MNQEHFLCRLRAVGGQKHVSKNEQCRHAIFLSLLVFCKTSFLLQCMYAKIELVRASTRF